MGSFSQEVLSIVRIRHKKIIMLQLNDFSGKAGMGGDGRKSSMGDPRMKYPILLLMRISKGNYCLTCCLYIISSWRF